MVVNCKMRSIILSPFELVPLGLLGLRLRTERVQDSRLGYNVILLIFIISVVCIARTELVVNVKNQVSGE